MDYNVPGGKLNRGMSVVDSVAILKGRELTEGEYFKAAVLGWSVEWVRLFTVRCPCVVSKSALAPSLLPRFRRHYGREHHPSRATLLVPRGRCWSYGYQRRPPFGRGDLPNDS